MKKSILALSILLSTSAMADYGVILSGENGINLPEPALSIPPPLGEVGECVESARFGNYNPTYTSQ